MAKKFSTEGLKVLATGSFSTAFIQKNGRILLKSADIPKQAMSDRLFPKHRLFPEVNYVGHEGSKALYDMPRYKQGDIRKLLNSERQKRLYDALDEILYRVNNRNSFEENIEVLKSIPSEFYREKKAIIAAYEFIFQFVKGELCMEHWDCNLAVKGGKLIMLDSFFSWESEKRHEGTPYD